MQNYQLRILILRKLFAAFLFGMITMGGFGAWIAFLYAEKAIAGFFTLMASISFGAATMHSFRTFALGLFLEAPTEAKSTGKKYRMR